MNYSLFVYYCRNPSGGCLVMTETGSLDRAKALERRKQKNSVGALGINMVLSSEDPQVTQT